MFADVLVPLHPKERMNPVTVNRLILAKYLSFYDKIFLLINKLLHYKGRRMDSQIRRRIAHLSQIAQYLSLLFLIGTPVLYFWLLYDGGFSILLKLPKETIFDEAMLTTSDKSIIALIPLVPIVVYLLLFLRLFRLFDLFKKGELFSHNTVAAILYIGYLLIALDFVKIVESLLRSMVLDTLGATQSGVQVDIGFSMLIIGVFVVIVGHIWKISLQMYEDERLTV